MSEIVLIITIIFVIIGAVFLIFGFINLKKFQLIMDTPTSKIRSMAMGLVELNVSISGGQFIKTPFSHTDCVYYNYRIEEYRRHTHTDSKGHTRVTYSWDTVSTGERRTSFFVSDETGQVYVEPNKAEISAPLKKVYYQHSGSLFGFSNIINALRAWNAGQSNYLDVDRWELVSMDPNHHHRFNARVGDRKYFEYYLSQNEDLYIIGTAADRVGVPNNVLIQKGENEPTFIITYKSEQQLLSSFKWQIAGFMILGSIFVILGIVLGWLFMG